MKGLNEKYLILFGNCIPVKGYKRSAIYDLQRLEYFLIPNQLYDIIGACKNSSLETVKKEFCKEGSIVFDEYIEFLLTTQLAMLIEKEEVKDFPQISSEWEYPGIISNALLDYGYWCEGYFEKAILELNKIGCFNLQLRCYENLSIDSLKGVLTVLENTRISSVELVLKFDEEIHKALSYFIAKFPRIKNIIIHTTPGNIIKESTDPERRVFYYSENILNEENCGYVCPQYFTINTWLYTESLAFNTCLNRKISIDKNGFIKNCPSFKENFGHIKNRSIEEIATNSAFKVLGSIKKDDILVCKDCEFRYMCTDCRAYLSNPEDKYSKPLKCGYNPYTVEWNDWKLQDFALSASTHYGFAGKN